MWILEWHMALLRDASQLGYVLYSQLAVSMDISAILILAIGSAIIGLLLALLRRPAAGAGQNSAEHDSLKQEAEKWEARWNADRSEFDEKEASLRETIDSEKQTSSQLRTDLARLETELNAARERELKGRAGKRGPGSRPPQSIQGPIQRNARGWNRKTQEDQQG